MVNLHISSSFAAMRATCDYESLVGADSFDDGARPVIRAPMNQPDAPSSTVKPNQIKSTVLSGTLLSARIPARIMPSVKPVVMPTRQPGCRRLRPSNRFIIGFILPLQYVTVTSTMIARLARGVKVEIERTATPILSALYVFVIIWQCVHNAYRGIFYQSRQDFILS